MKTSNVILWVAIAVYYTALACFNPPSVASFLFGLLLITKLVYELINEDC